MSLPERQRHRLTIIRAHTLLYRSIDVLADFEIDLIRDVHARVIRPLVTVGSVTPAEWQVIDDAISAMQRAPRQDLTCEGQAA